MQIIIKKCDLGYAVVYENTVLDMYSSREAALDDAESFVQGLREQGYKIEIVVR